MKTLPRLPKFDRLEIAVLVELYLGLSKETDSQQMYESNLIEALDLGIGGGIVSPLLDRCNTRKYFFRDESERDGVHFRISNAGIALLAEHQDQPNAEISAYTALGASWVVGKTDTPSLVEEDPFDDTWEPLPIERSSPHYDDAVDALQRAYDAVRSDNGYASTSQSERNSVVAALESGLEWLRTKSEIPRRLLQSLILDPLQRGIERFKEALPGALAKAAIDAVIKLLLRS